MAMNKTLRTSAIMFPFLLTLFIIGMTNIVHTRVEHSPSGPLRNVRRAARALIQDIPDTPVAVETSDVKRVPSAIRELPVLETKTTHQPYKCWVPEGGLSEPVVTLTTIWSFHKNATIDAWIRNNKLAYAKEHGYRYCEMRSGDPLREFAGWGKMSIMTSLLPCSDYVVWMDADVIIYNNTQDLSSYFQVMEEDNLGVLLSTGYGHWEKINNGFFIVKNQPFVYTMFQELYNVCQCDRTKMTGWPHEQGMTEQWIVRHENDTDNVTDHVKIIPNANWNVHFFGYRGREEQIKVDKLLAVHYAGCCYLPDGAWTTDARVKYPMIMRDYDTVVGTGPESPMGMLKESDFHTEDEICLPITVNRIVHSEVYDGHYWLSSSLTYDVDVDNRIRGISLSSAVCPWDVVCSGWNDVQAWAAIVNDATARPIGES